ncbi:membrane dipeptidase [Runella aurantiaca]|uniref:Peptidase M19 n=1 Tax=Runella aurantiaca TaxID=2282308 RepID=A0A369I3C3_9BACT|nr:membrane dipeptidase [Runella aurantiaca]RDB03410.1 hypothetical protein DVG78_24000 [Runella aurantiaca]
MKPYVDFHTHTFLKTHLNVDEIQNAKSPFTILDVDIPLNADQFAFNDVVDSQASFTQIAQGKGNLVVVSLFPVENAYTKATFIKLLKLLTKDLSKKLIQTIEKEQISYWEILMRELEHALKYQNTLHDVEDNGVKRQISYKFIHSMNEFDAARNDILHVILSIEGGHAFYENPQILNQNPANIINRVREFKTPTATRPRLSHITLAHHAQNRFANQAHAIPLDCAGKGGANPVGGYNPTGYGLTEEGKDFVRECLRETDVEKRILLDIKHLSVIARDDYYKLVAAEFPQTPLIATHMGVTGFSVRSAKYVKEGNLTDIIRGITEFTDKRCYKVHYNQIFAFELNRDTVCFNPWSINLYDDEIVKIIASGTSGGLIGLVMDERILGKTKSITNYHSPELFSKKTRDERGSLLDAPLCVNGYLQGGVIEDDILDINTDPRNAHANGIYYFLNNWLHIVKIGGDEAWKSVCLGSDYDGLINALDIAPKANFIEHFRQRLADELPIIAAIKEVVLPASPEDLVDALLFDNAVDFLKKNWK